MRLLNCPSLYILLMIFSNICRESDQHYRFWQNDMTAIPTATSSPRNFQASDRPEYEQQPEANMAEEEGMQSHQIVVISAVLDSRTVFVRPSQGPANMLHLRILRLAAEYGNKSEPVVGVPEVGSIVLASCHKVFYRARILNVSLDTQQVLIEFVDFGDQETVPLHRLKQLSSELRAQKVIPTKIRLAGIKENGPNEQNAIGLLKHISSQMQGMTLIKIENPEGDEYILRFVIDNKSLNDEVAKWTNN